MTGREAGQYTCKAENEAGRTDGTATLIVQEAPSITMEPAGSTTVQLGQAISLRCIAGGDPRPTVRWKKLDQ